jgi:hypothetical protein
MHYIFLHFVSLIIFGKVCKLWSLFLCSFLQPPFTFPLRSTYSSQHPVFKHSQSIFSIFGNIRNICNQQSVCLLVLPCSPKGCKQRKNGKDKNCSSSRQNPGKIIAFFRVWKLGTGASKTLYISPQTVYHKEIVKTTHSSRRDKAGNITDFFQNRKLVTGVSTNVYNGAFLPMVHHRKNGKCKGNFPLGETTTGKLLTSCVLKIRHRGVHET